MRLIITGIKGNHQNANQIALYYKYGDSINSVFAELNIGDAFDVLDVIENTSNNKDKTIIDILGQKSYIIKYTADQIAIVNRTQFEFEVAGDYQENKNNSKY